MRNAPLLLVVLLLVVGAVFYLLLGGGEVQEVGPGLGAGPVAAAGTGPERTTDIDGVGEGSDEDAPRAERSAVDGMGLPQAGLGTTDDDEEDLEGRPMVRGRVVDDNGTPLPGARILAAGADGLPMDLDMDANTGWGKRWSVLTGTDGRFELRGPEAGALRLAVRHAGFAPLDVDGLTLPAGEGADFGDLVVEDSVVLEGRVLVAGGGPVAGAELFRVDTSGGMGFFFGPGLPMRPAAVTDDAGRFRVDMLAAGPWKLRVESAGQPDRTFEGRTERPGERQGGLEFLLEPGSTIAGRVTDMPTGAHQGLVVRATPRASNPFGQASGYRDSQVQADGSFSVEGCDPGETYELQARIIEEDAPVWSGARKTRTAKVEALAGQSGILLEWAGTTGVAFQIVDATGTPLEDFTVTYGAGYQRKHRVDGDVVEHFPDGRVLLEELSQDSWNEQAFQVKVHAVGFEVLTRDVELRTGEVQDLGALALAPAPVVLVRVLDDTTGLPVEDARVTLTVGTESSPDVQFGGRGFAISTGVGGVGGDDVETHSGMSDATGLARITSFPGRTASLRVEHDDHTPYDLDQLVLPAEVGLEREVRLGIGGTVRVLVLDAFGEPAPGVRVHERTPPEPQVGGGSEWGMISAGGFGGSREGEVTDGEGVALFEHLQPGTHEFRIAKAQSGGMIFAVEGVSSEPEEWTPAEVTEGGEEQLTLRQEPTSSLSGRLLEAGEPLAGATVSLSSVQEGDDPNGFGNFIIPGMDGPNSATTDGRGNFSIEGVEPGSYEIRVTHSSRVMAAVFDQELVVGENRRDLDLPVAIVEGRVTRSDGTPVAGVDVEVRRATGASSAGYQAMMFLDMGGDGATVTVGDQAADPTVTGPDGRYRLRGVETGIDLVVEAEHEQSAPAQSELLRLEDGQLLGDVDLVLDPAGAIEVEVVDLGQNAFPMINVERLQADGSKEPVRNGFAPSGKETFGGLTPGVYVVTCQVMGAGASTEREPVQVEVVAGETTPVQILP